MGSIARGDAGSCRQRFPHVCDLPSVGRRTVASKPGLSEKEQHSLVAHARQRLLVQEAKVSGVDDRRRFMLANQSVELVVCA